MLNTFRYFAWYRKTVKATFVDTIIINKIVDAIFGLCINIKTPAYTEK